MDKIKLDDSVLKIIMFIIIVLVIMYYLNKGIDGIESIFGQSKEKKEEIAKQAVIGINNAKINDADGKVSYKRETFVNLASKLYDANSKLFFDSMAVKDVFSLLKSVADVKFLIQVYGIREGKNLVQYLRSIIPKVNYIGLSLNDLNGILSKNKVRYSF